MTLHPDGDTFHPWDVGEMGMFKESEFIERPRILDTDSLDIPKIVARLIFSSILPKDKASYFGDFEIMYDHVEIFGLRVNYFIYFLLWSLIYFILII